MVLIRKGEGAENLENFADFVRGTQVGLQIGPQDVC